jgi:hypothetical protein
MTDVPYTDAETLARGLADLYDKADDIATETNAVRIDLSGCLEIAGDYATDEQGNVTNPGLARELLRMRELVSELEALAARMDTQRTETERLDKLAGGIEMDLDDLQHEQQDTADLAEMIRDVERGIRDPSELRYAIERIEPNYVL